MYLAHLSDDPNIAPQSVEEHVLAVAALARDFAESLGIPSAGELCGLLHDMGKFSTAFQDYISSAQGRSEQDADAAQEKPVRGSVDHSTAGAQLLWQSPFSDEQLRRALQVMALCIASHHSGLINCLPEDSVQGFVQRMGKDDRQSHLTECQKNIESTLPRALDMNLRKQAITEIFNAINKIEKHITTVMSTEQQKLIRFQTGLLTRFLLSCLVDADHTDSANFTSPKEKSLRASLPRKPWARLTARLEAKLAGFSQRHAIDTLRARISENCFRHAADASGLFTLTVPTGGGKTLSSLRFALHHAQAHDLERIIYVIPYTSIIDQNAAVARDILEEGETAGSIVLEHHANILPENETWHSKLLQASWDAPVIFTTMVQFLESLYGKGTKKTRRMHNLARSVLIFDEVQTVPVHCLQLFCNAVDFLVQQCGSTAVFCTATQPRLEKVPGPLQHLLPQATELAPDVPETFQQLRRVNFVEHKESPLSPEQVAALAISLAAENTSCLVIGNTKGWVERVFTALREQGWQGQLVFLSTDLCPAHRLDLLASLRQKLDQKLDQRMDGGEPIICCSTQLIECGVDISFGAVIRTEAGLDSILQAAGRCNRNGERPQRGTVHIVRTGNGDEELGSLLDIELARAAYRDMRNSPLEHGAVQNADLSAPAVMAQYSSLYLTRREKDTVDAYKDGDQIKWLSINDSNPLSSPKTGYTPPPLVQCFAKAADNFSVIESQTEAVLVPYGQGAQLIAALCSAEGLYRQKELLRKAQRYSVNLFPKTMKALRSHNALNSVRDTGILILDPRFYSQERGVVTSPEGEMATLCL